MAVKLFDETQDKSTVTDLASRIRGGRYICGCCNHDDGSRPRSPISSPAATRRQSKAQGSPQASVQANSHSPNGLGEIGNGDALQAPTMEPRGEKSGEPSPNEQFVNQEKLGTGYIDNGTVPQPNTPSPKIDTLEQSDTPCKQGTNHGGDPQSSSGSRSPVVDGSLSHRSQDENEGAAETESIPSPPPEIREQQATTPTKKDQDSGGREALNRLDD